MIEEEKQQLNKRGFILRELPHGDVEIEMKDGSKAVYISKEGAESYAQYYLCKFKEK